MKTMEERMEAAHRALCAAKGLEQLRAALSYFKEAGAAKVVERLRKALKSAEGAKRHAILRVVRAETEERKNG